MSGLLLSQVLSCEAARIEMEGLACDAAGRCASGYECWQGSCVASGSARIVDAAEPSTQEESSAAAEPASSLGETTEITVEDTELESSGISDIGLFPEPSAPSSELTFGSDEATDEPERTRCLDAAVPDAGVCAETCAPPLLLCGASCVDPRVDPLHCGQCNLLCEVPRLGSAACVAGVCEQLCVEGSIVCDGWCTDITSRRQDCGACGNRCAGGLMCIDSLCQ